VRLKSRYANRRAYILFGGFNAGMFIKTFFRFPETAGETLKETEAMFEDPNGLKFSVLLV